MAITIAGPRLKSLSIDIEEGKVKVNGKYDLMGSNDKVIAKQGFNGYQELELGISPATAKALNDLQASIKTDLITTMGLE